MVKYFKWMAFHGISSFESFVKFVCSVFRWYPDIDLSTSFLMMFEVRRIKNTVSNTQERRETGTSQFKALRSEAYDDGEV